MYRKAAGLTLLCLLIFMPQAMAEMDEELAQAKQYLQAGDHKKAYKSYLALAKQGSFESQYVLASLYVDGKGTKQDPVEGYAWSVLAAESQNQEYVAYSEQLLDGIEDKKEAHYKAEKYRDKYGAEAQFERAQRTAMRRMDRAQCTGSRLSCGQNTQIYSTPIGDEGGVSPSSVTTEGGN